MAVSISLVLLLVEPLRRALEQTFADACEPW
jgi:hypothetical protein